MDKIEDIGQLVDWLVTQDASFSSAIATRNALRILPTAMAGVEQSFDSFEGADLLMLCLMLDLMSAVASTCSSIDLRDVRSALQRFRANSTSEKALLDATRISDSGGLSPFSAHSAGSSAASSVIFSGLGEKKGAAVFADGSSAHAFAPQMQAASFADCQSIDANGTTGVFNERLWPDGEGVQQVLALWHTFKALPDPKGTWDFWRRWYRGMLEGQPLDWDLQLQVALIGDDIWDSGPEAVAREIARIEAKWELEREVVALKEQLAKVKQLEALPSRLHNQPPEAIDDTIGLFQTDVALIWDTLVELEEEIEKPEPSPSRLKKIAEVLLGIAKKFTVYCAELGGITAKKAAEEIGTTGTKWAIRGTAAFFTAENEGVQSVVKAIWEYAKTLPPG
ncbi:hypothetical protein [Shimia sp. NS0008-38b]|uniref:hypothetical protein n=1 Tax=Shimia sp. NS0008-38b TaxID=3127653 RepID=UPI00333F0D25